MWIKVRKKNGIVCARFISSEILDEGIIQATGIELMELVEAASEHKKLLLDFKNVRFMSSAMIGKLVLLNNKARDHGITLKFCNISRDVLEVFNMTRLDRTFRIIREEDLDAGEWREDPNDDDDRSGSAGVFAKLPKHPSSGGGHAIPPRDES